MSAQYPGSRTAILGVIHRHCSETSFNFTPEIFTPGLSPLLQDWVPEVRFCLPNQNRAHNGIYRFISYSSSMLRIQLSAVMSASQSRTSGERIRGSIIFGLWIHTIKYKTRVLEYNQAWGGFTYCVVRWANGPCCIMYICIYVTGCHRLGHI